MRDLNSEEQARYEDLQQAINNLLSRGIKEYVLALLDDLVEVFVEELEVLDILKETIKNNCFDVDMVDNKLNGETWLSCEDYGITLKTEDYHKIKEWLENE